MQNVRVIIRKDPPAGPALTARIGSIGHCIARLRCRIGLWIGTITGHGKRFGRHLFADTINTREDKRVGNVAFSEQGGQQTDCLLLTLYQIKSIHSYGRPRRRQLLMGPSTRSRNSLPDLKNGSRLGLINTRSPVLGLRPV